MNATQQANAVKLDKLLEASGLKAVGEWQYHKLTSDGYMPLSIDRLGKDPDGSVRLSLAHNSVQNGDVMADPDMEIAYFSGEKPYIVAMHYQNDYVGAFHTVERSNTTQTDLDSFLGMWLKNLLEQGHKLHADDDDEA